jgi:hypothetical protein
MNANVYVIEDYENETAFRPKKTNPIKPNLVLRRRIPIGQNELKIACQKIWPHPSKLHMKNNSLPCDQKGYNLPINQAFLAYRSNGSKCKVTEIYRYLLKRIKK